jgi:Dolichyl-phosphate-mannose-protein mannosyltransferase
MKSTVAQQAAVPPRSAGGDAGPEPDRRRRPPTGWALALVAVVAAALGLRLWSIGHGLPLVFNPDEELHFVPKAVEMADGDLNPHYFQNPPALTYLLQLVFRFRFRVGFPFGGGSLRPSFLNDPTAAFATARVVVALLGTLVVGLTFWAGSRLFCRRAGIVAAAVIAVAFLPVFYSKQALNDVAALVPITVALVVCVSAWRRGRPRDWAVAGAAIGVATATKYTAGAMLVTVGLAALFRLREGQDRPRTAALVLAGAGTAFAVAYAALNPFSLLDFGSSFGPVLGQAQQAGVLKLGQEDGPGWLYYLWTLTWGLGWLPLAAAVAGAVLLLRTDPRRGLLVLAFPILLLVVLSLQARWFGRWLLPAYPALSVLAGHAATRAADAVRARTGWPGWHRVVLVGLAGLLLVQGTVASVRVDRVLGRTDTRELARGWLERNLPPGSRIVIEPFIPAGFLSGGALHAPPRYRQFPVRRPFASYIQRLRPGLIDVYRREGYCWVVVGSHQKDRGLQAGLANARAYYQRLDTSSQQVVVLSPYRPGARPVTFNFDLSSNYLPSAYERPGPLVQIHRLAGCTPG